MAMNEVIRQKRKELDYTQEQVARQLGVSIPAVSKWESGATYPDVELLPALARVLKIDVNTLMCFKQELSDTEIGQFVNQMTELAMKDGMAKAFPIAEEKIREYPTDVKLIHTLAITLQGLLMMSPVAEEDKNEYDQKIQQMYERVGSSGNSKYADQSNYMLAGRAIADQDYEHAQELIDRLPEYSSLDKTILQANLWLETGKEEEAEKVYASKAIAGINEVQLPLLRLIEVTAKKGDALNVSQLVECGKAFTKAFGMWDYNSYVFDFERAVAQKDAKDTMRVLEPMLDAMLIPWDISSCPLYTHLGEVKESFNFGEKMLHNMMEVLQTSDKYEYLRNETGFKELLQKYTSRK